MTYIGYKVYLNAHTVHTQYTRMNRVDLKGGHKMASILSEFAQKLGAAAVAAEPSLLRGRIIVASQDAAEQKRAKARKAAYYKAAAKKK